jgi:hypothetical protein
MENKQTLNNKSYLRLLSDLKKMLESGKDKAEEEAAGKLILTYWQIGKRINQEKISANSGYKTSIIKELTEELELEKTTLSRCITFYKTYKTPPKNKILSWSHYKDLLSVKDDAQRLMLEKQAEDEGWSRQKLLSAIRKLQQEEDPKSKNKLVRPQSLSYIYKAKIIEVIDGDTLLLDIDLGFQVHKEQRVRIAEIDSPEMDTKEGKAAFHHLRDKLSKISEVVIRTRKIDIYGRYLGYIFYSKIDEFKMKE